MILESPEKIFPAKLICGIIFHETIFPEEILKLLEKEWGDIDHISDKCAFSKGTTYYVDEVGGDHSRIFVSFKNLVHPQVLPLTKKRSIELEAQIAKNYELGRRPVNLDPGLIMRGRMVLATTKDFSHRLYLGEGIYGELTLLFKKKSLDFMEWTYPDIKEGTYNNMLLKAKDSYLQAIS